MSLKRLLLSAANKRLARIERKLNDGTRPQERVMPRKKSPVPTPKHVTQEAKAARAVRGARRDGKKLRVVAGTAAARALGIK